MPTRDFPENERTDQLIGAPVTGGDSPARVVLGENGHNVIDLTGRPGRRGRSGSRLVRLIRFGIVGLSGLLLNQAALWASTDLVGIHYLASAVLATQISTAWNFALTEWWVFRAGRSGRLRRLMLFALMNNAWLVARAPLLYVLTDWAGIHYLVSNLVALAASTIGRFLVADTWIWSRLPGSSGSSPRFLYDIHGIVRVASAARLPELGAFRVEELKERADIEIEISNRGFGRPRWRPLVTFEGTVTTYVEHLGALGFAMRVDMGDPVRVQASRFVRFSPHVLYTNVIEPTLRWVFVKKGYVLAHAACLELGGKGLLITAQTDTGKTTTCLRSIRTDGAVFLSDDMTILDQLGNALSFPKPLTISAHTLKAVKAAPLPWWRWPLLQVQSRLHSKSGRGFALWLSKHNLPVATINALVQILIPPPKFFVERLIPETVTRTTLPIDHLVVIERGEELIERLRLDETCRVLKANTEDAYGFPPYPLIAQGLHNGDAPVEARIQQMVAGRLTVSRIRTPDRNWFERIRTLLQEPVLQAPGSSLVETEAL